MTAERTFPCPRCQAQQLVSAQFCSSCGLPLGAATSAPVAGPPAQTRQDLASYAVSSAHWGVVQYLFTVGGLGAGFLAGIWVAANTVWDLRILMPFILPFAGAYIGWRLALSLWASR